MKIAPVLAALLAAGALSAQENANLDARIQVFADVTQPRSFSYYNITSDVKTEAGRQIGVGFRILGELPYTTGWYYELGGRFDSSSTLGLRDATVDATDVKMRYSYWSAGFAYLWTKGPASFGLHLEGRGEAVSLQGEQFHGTTGLSQGKVDASSTYLRPWVRASFDLTMGSGKVRPYIGAEAAVAVTRTYQTRIPSFTTLAAIPDDRTIRSLAPNFSFAGYLGLRF